MNTVTVVSQIAIAVNLVGGLFFVFHKPAKSQKLSASVFLATVIVAALLLHWAAINYYYSAEENPGGIFRFGATLGVTLKMFTFEWEWELCAALAQESIWYSVAIILCFVSAILNTMLLVVRLLLTSLWNAMSVFFLIHSGKKLWLIAGTGVHQKTLLENITPEQKNNTIIIPNETNEDAKKEYLARGFLVIDEKISVGLLKKAWSFSGREMVLVAISDNDVENLETARTTAACLQSFSTEERKKLRFSARIMYTNIERVEHFTFIEGEAAGGHIQFFIPYEIMARSFLFDNPVTKFIPPPYIDFRAARLKGAFDFLHVFIGFGKANRELLKQSIAADQLLGMNYHALVIDASLENSKNAFMNQCRGIFASEDERDSTKYFPVPEEKYHIEFVECNVLSKKMYDTVISCVKNAGASVVVVSLGNVQLSVETAMELRQQCYTENIAKEKIHILVHTYTHSPIVAEDVLNNKDAIDNGITIETFGFDDEIFSLERIANREMDILAKHAAENYASSPGIKYPAVWDKLSNHERESNRYAALSVKVKLNLMGFDLVYDTAETAVQDERTLKEFKEAYGLERALRLRSAGDALSYLERDVNGNIADTARNNLARLEHQRWNAFHMIKGWTPMPKERVTAQSRKIPREKKHACITTFEGLVELRDLQASLECAQVSGPERDAALKKNDTIQFDFDIMDCLEGNLKDTKYRIVKKA